MSDEGGIYSNLLNLQKDATEKFNPSVECTSTLGYTVVGEEFTFGPNTVPARPEDFEFGKKFWAVARELLAAGSIKAHKFSVNKYGEGFEGILKGLDAMKNGKVSGEKLVYTI